MALLDGEGKVWIKTVLVFRKSLVHEREEEKNKQQRNKRKRDERKNRRTDERLIGRKDWQTDRQTEGLW